MSSYYPSFSYLNKNSYDDYHLIVAHFDADNGEHDTWLGMEPVYSESANGTHRIDYGAKFNDVAKPKITLIKSNGSDFTVREVRDFLKWVTGRRKNSYLDLCEWDELQNTWKSKFRFLGRVTAAYQQKLDSRTVGLAIEFTTVSPFAYSPVQTISATINGESVAIKVPHDSDDFDTLIGLNVEFINTGSGDDTLSIISDVMGKEMKVNGLRENETITIDSNGFIVSDFGRVLGNDFNYIFPKIGYNADMEKVDTVYVTGHGNITLKYIYFIKLGDCTIDSDISSGDLCGCHGSDSGSSSAPGYSSCTVDENELNAMLAEVLA